MNAALCIDPGARICLFRHLHALRHNNTAKPCHGCEPAAETVAVLRAAKAAPVGAPDWGDAPGEREGMAAMSAMGVAVPCLGPQLGAGAAVAVVPAPGGLDLAALRVVLLPILEKQGRAKQKTLYVERLQGLYNAKAPAAARVKAKRRFREALAAMPGLTLAGSYLELDAGCRAFCMEGR